jgi:hypothetical protein
MFTKKTSRQPTAVGAVEQLLHQPGGLRVDQAAEQPLKHPSGDQEAGRGGETRQRRGDDESTDPDLEHQPASVIVAQLATEDRNQTERERVPGHDPLELRRAGTRVVPD